MKNLFFGALAAVGFLVALSLAFDLGSTAFGQRGATYQTPAAGSELIVVPAAVGDKAQVLTVVDPRQRGDERVPHRPCRPAKSR